MGEPEKAPPGNWEAIAMAWPLPDVLATLVRAARHLLEDHGCDTHGYEQILVCVRVADVHLELAEARSEAESLRRALGWAPDWKDRLPDWKKRAETAEAKLKEIEAERKG